MLAQDRRAVTDTGEPQGGPPADQAEQWLHPHRVVCPQCHAQLFSVLHSPFADDYVLYCDRCARRVEVSFYDPVVLALDTRLRDTFGTVDRGN